MKKKFIFKSYLIWFCLMNSISFVGGISDIFYLIPYAEKGGTGGFPIFSILGIYVGCIVGLLYSLINLRNSNILKQVKILQIIISVCGLFFPILPFTGAVLGWGVGSILIKLF